MRNVTVSNVMVRNVTVSVTLDFHNVQRWKNRFEQDMNMDNLKPKEIPPRRFTSRSPKSPKSPKRVHWKTNEDDTRSFHQVWRFKMVTLINMLSQDHWTDKGIPPMNPSKIGDYKFFTLFHAKKNDDENRMEYYLRGGDGPPILAYLEHFGGRKNPLFDISTCYLKLDERDDASIITGIILDTDWVEIK